MKKKIALFLALVFALTIIGTVLVACNKTTALTDEQLTSLIAGVRSYHKDDAAITNSNYGVIGTATINGEDGEIVVDVAWTSSSSLVTISSEMSNGFYQVTVPARESLTEDLSYTLTATLVDESGNPYKNENGETYSVSFKKTVEMIDESEPDAVLTLDNTGKLTTGEAVTDSYGNSGYSTVTWSENGITLLNDMASSKSACVTYTNPARFYAQSLIEISYTEPIKAIRLTLNSSSSSAHATGFDNMSVAGATFTRIGDVLVIAFDSPVEKFVSAPLAAQTRINKVEVFTNYVPELDEEVRYETEAEILEALKKLQPGETLSGGEYTLTGTITSIDTAYDATYGNVTVTIEVGAEKLAIQCFRMKGGEDLVVGDEITVTGTLLNYDNGSDGKLEFNSGCTYTKAGDSTGNEAKADAMLTLDNASKLTLGEACTDSYGNSGYATVTWSENGITLFNDMAESMSACGTYTAPARFYASSLIEISYTSPIKAIRLTLNSSANASHVTGFDGMEVAGATFTRVDNVLVIAFDNSVEKFVSAPLGAQTRIDKVEVFTDSVPELEKKEEIRYGTVEEIIAALKQLKSGETLSGGQYTLTGPITAINTPYDSGYKNVTVTIAVGDESYPVQCFRLSGGEELVVGDVITVTGTLKNYNGTIEFDSGCTYVKDGGSQSGPGTGGDNTPVIPGDSLQAKIQYTAGTTTNMSGENDANSVFGLDASIFTITSEKTNSGNNHVGLNKANNMRLYKNETATLHISLASGYVIDSIVITLASTSPSDFDGLKVAVNGAAVSGANGAYTINASSVSLSSIANDQVHIESIVVYYHAA